MQPWLNDRKEDLDAVLTLVALVPEEERAEELAERATEWGYVWASRQPQTGRLRLPAGPRPPQAAWLRLAEASGVDSRDR